MTAPDLAGQTFGSWTPLARDPAKTSKWLCRCTCGTLGSVEGSYLVRGRSRQCRDCRDRSNRKPRGLTHDHAGQTFGKLSVVEHVGSGRWRCLCDCGEERLVAGAGLRSGSNVSCGCDQAVRKKGEEHPRHSGDQIRYAAAHQRVRAARGRARDQACIVCEGPAASWAYRGNSPKELREWREAGVVKKGWLRYSPDPSDYDPMCWSCHARKDVVEARSRT